MAENITLPPGQFLAPSFGRFGLGRFANRFPAQPDTVALKIGGAVARPVAIGAQLAELPRVEQVSDFHCVTTWSCVGLRWGGVSFADFYHRIVVTLAGPEAGAGFVVLRGGDGYHCAMLLEDLLAPGVLLADTLDGEKLGLEHGAPLRLVAPAHYGYKNVKHIGAIEFWHDRKHYRFPYPYPDFMDHPRGRVALEERARWFPAWLLRPFYRVLIPLARRKSRKALAAYDRAN